MKVLSFDYDVNYGLAWIVIDGKNEGEEWTVQCWLASENEPETNALIRHKKEIIITDCGHGEGDSGELNEKAFNYWGENRCMKALFTHAKSHGIKITGGL